MDVILGMAHRRGMDAAAAMDRFAQAAQGNVRGLERYTALTRDQVQALSQLEDAEERARVATNALREAYAGAAQEADSIAVSMHRLDNVHGTILKVFGEAIIESETIAQAFEELVVELEKVMDWFVENREVVQEWADTTGIVLIATVREATDAINRIIDALEILGPLAVEMSDETEVFGDRMIGLTNAMGKAFSVMTAGFP